MDRYRWSYLLAAVLLGVAAAILFFSTLVFPPEAQAQMVGGRSPQAATIPASNFSSPIQPNFPAAPARPIPTTTDPRTLTAPHGWRTVAGVDAVREFESRAPGASDPALLAGLDPQSLPPGLTVDLAYHVVMGWVNPGDLVTVTTPAGYGVAVADGAGFFWTPIWHPDGYPLDILPGEPVHIQVDFSAGGWMTATTTPPLISGGLDLLANTVYGWIDGDSGGTAVTLAMGLWAQSPFPGAPSETAVTLGDGSFTAVFAADLGAENLVAVDVLVGATNVRSYLYPDPAVFLVQQYDVIAGYGPIGQPVQATVYADYPGDVRWSGETWAGGPHGFYQFGNVGWNEVEIEVGDVVVVELDGGMTLSTTVIELGNLIFDTALDQFQGTVPEGTTVKATLWQWQGGDLLYHQAHAVAGPGGQFTLSYAADLRPRDDVDVMAADAHGHQIQLISGPPFVSAWDDPYSELDCVFGRLDGPGLPITVSLATPDQTYVRDTGWSSDAGNRLIGCFLIRDPEWAWGPINFSPGDIAALKSPTWQGAVEIVTVNWAADTAANTISGDAPSGDLEIIAYQWQDWGYPLRGAATRTAVAASPFAADFSGFDLRDSVQLVFAHFDATTGYGNRTADWGRATLPYFEIHLPHGVHGMSGNPHEMVTASLYDENHVLLAQTHQDHDDHPFYFWLSDFSGYPLQAGYWITLTGELGWTAGMEIPHLSIDGDPQTDRVTAVGPAALLFLEGGREESGFGAFVPGPDAVLDTTAVGHDLNWGDDVTVFYQAINGNRAHRSVRLGELHRVEFWLNPDGLDWMWGQAQEGATVTITTPYLQVVVWADPACGGCWNLPEPVDINPGDMIHVIAGEGLFPVTIEIPDPLTAEADSDLNEVWGQIGGRAEDWLAVHGWWDDGYRETTTDAAGNFSVIYPNVPRGGQGNIRFGGSVGYTEVFIHQSFQTSDLILRVNYAHDWVESNYEAGHTVWLTLTDSLGHPKATAGGVTGPIPWWGGQSGFSTNYNVLWSGQHPDIQPGDWVHAAMSDGQTGAVRIGVINGTLDIDNDTISGDIHAPWFSDPLEGGCGVWVHNGPGMGFMVDPDGGSYFCDFGDMGWDLQPGQMVGVDYRQPDGHQVINVFEEPAPRLFIQQWSNGQPAEGGNFIFRIEYLNEGGAPAEDTVITATLHGFAYLSDTSGFPTTTGVTPDGDPYVAWELGTVDAYYGWATFELFVKVTAATGESVHHIAQIGTSNPYNTSDPGMLIHVWEGEVVVNDTYLNVGKGAWTWHPAAGYHFVYNINVCNNGSTGSAAVTLTDTLPLSTTLQSWWGQDAGWQEVAFGNQLLVVTRPSLPAWSCSEIYLRVYLDESAWPEMELVNTAVIHAANDLSPDDNEATLWHSVGYPHNNLGVHLNWHGGSLVPGGQIRYGLHLHNHGNLPIAGLVRITDTLPAGTTFHSWHSWGWAEVSLVDVTDTHVVWQLDGFENGYYAGIELVLNINAGVAPGTILVNQAEITMPPGDVDPDNNFSSWTETVYPPGPNLRLRKYADWHGHGEGHNAWYRLEVENVGDQTVNDVTISDHYPPEMVLDSGPHVGYWQWWDWVHDPDSQTFTVTLEALQPGWNVHVHYDMRIPGDEPVPGGWILTNTANVTLLANDANPADNSATLTLFTGPDFYIEKSVAAGDFLPGEPITYLLHFGNNQAGHAWWWNPQAPQWVSDTLPAGLSYVAAYQRWCGEGEPEWCEMPPHAVNGQTVSWEHWLGGGAWNEILLVAAIGDTLTGLDTVVNEAIIASAMPDLDVEPFYDNNSSSRADAIMLPYFTISKVYDSSRIAGLLVTYTLTVENPGHASGSGLVISDALPANVTYLSGGSFDGATQTVSWHVAELGTGESVPVQFVGRLAHSGIVVNDQYRVAGSNEGVISEWGPAVTFTIVPPTINPAFTQSATHIMVGESVSFGDASTTNGAPLVAWLWYFGDGQTSTDQHPVHLYTAAGIYTVSLSVTDSAGHEAAVVTIAAVTVESGMTYVYLPLIKK